MEAASFVHPTSASSYVNHAELRKTVLEAVDEKHKVKCMVWRDGDRADMHLVRTDADYDLICKYARDTTKRFPMFIVLVEKMNVVPPPTTPPPNGGPVIKLT